MLIILLVTSICFSFSGSVKPWYWGPSSKQIIKPSNHTHSSSTSRTRRSTENEIAGAAQVLFRLAPRDLPTHQIDDIMRTYNRYDPGWYGEWESKKNKTDEDERPPQQPPQAPGPGEYCPKDVVHDRYRGHGYFFSWEDRRSADLRMTWTQAINFCRARCLELVSIETIDEHDFLARHISSGSIRGTWTSGRKCDFPGCEKESHLQPVNTYGWFWEGARLQLPPTTDRFDTKWSNSGPLGKPQPDNSSGQKGDENESCLAILNNVFNDGITWHDEACSKRKRIICEEKDRKPYYPPI